jgi:hypothetical protein
MYHHQISLSLGSLLIELFSYSENYETSYINCFIIEKITAQSSFQNRQNLDPRKNGAFSGLWMSPVLCVPCLEPLLRLG